MDFKIKFFAVCHNYLVKRFIKFSAAVFDILCSNSGVTKYEKLSGFGEATAVLAISSLKAMAIFAVQLLL